MSPFFTKDHVLRKALAIQLRKASRAETPELQLVYTKMGTIGDVGQSGTFLGSSDNRGRSSVLRIT